MGIKNMKEIQMKVFQPIFFFPSKLFIRFTYYSQSHNSIYEIEMDEIYDHI